MDTGGKGSIWADFFFFFKLQIQNEPLKSSFSYFIKQIAEFSDLIPAGTICPNISDVECLTPEDHTTNLDKTVPS